MNIGGTQMKLKYNFLINKIADDLVAVPIGDGAIEFNSIIKLNDTAAFIFEQLNTEIQSEELISRVAKKYDCDVEEAEANVQNILSGLKSANLLVE